MASFRVQINKSRKICVWKKLHRVSTPRKLFDDAQCSKIEAFIKNLRKLVGFRARTSEINLFLAAMRAILWELARTTVVSCSSETRINKKSFPELPSHIDKSITSFNLYQSCEIIHVFRLQLRYVEILQTR